jgi:hypothetical protein
MRTVSKSLLTLSICLGLSGAVYAQAAPSNNVEKPAATHANHATKDKEKPAAASGSAKKLDTNTVKESKHNVAKSDTTKKPESAKAEAAKKVEKAEKPMHKAENKAEHVSSNTQKAMKHEGSKPAAKTPSESAAQPVK